MRNEQKMFWHCVSCLHEWEPSKEKTYTRCPNCRSEFIMDWETKEEEREKEKDV